MIHVVLDTNVLVSSLFGARDGSAPRQVLKLWREGAFTSCFSEASMAEAREVLGRFVDHPRDKDGSVQVLLRMLPDASAWVPLPPILPRVVPNDPDDDVIVATAVAGRVDAIVSGDADLLALGSHEGIPVLTPRQFIELLSKRAPGA